MDNAALLARLTRAGQPLSVVLGCVREGEPIQRRATGSRGYRTSATAGYTPEAAQSAAPPSLYGRIAAYWPRAACRAGDITAFAPEFGRVCITLHGPLDQTDAEKTGAYWYDVRRDGCAAA